MGDAIALFPAGDFTLRSSPNTKANLAERAALVRSPCFWPALPGKPPLPPAFRAGLIRLADSIPGQASDEQVVGLAEAMRHAPAGDVVDVGAGGGRTAAVLVWLARRYQIGAVLCLDRWTEAALAEFEIAVAPLAEGALNYLQATRAEYGPGLTVATSAFGETAYAGRIALLRLDVDDAGAAQRWTPHVGPGGWIVCGPPQIDAGKAFVAANRERISASFAAGEAFFVQLKR